MVTSNPNEIALLAEPVEADGDEAYWKLVPDALRKTHSIAHLRIAGALLTCISRSGKATGKAVNLGVDVKLKETDVDEMLKFFEEHTAKEISFKLSPGHQAGQIRAWLEKRGFEQKGEMARLSFPFAGKTIEPESSPVQISEVTGGQEL